MQAAVLKLAADSDWAVRRQLAATLGAFPANSAGETALVADARPIRRRSADGRCGAQRSRGTGGIDSAAIARNAGADAAADGGDHDARGNNCQERAGQGGAGSAAGDRGHRASGVAARRAARRRGDRADRAGRFLALLRRVATRMRLPPPTRLRAGAAVLEALAHFRMRRMRRQARGRAGRRTGRGQGGWSRPGRGRSAAARLPANRLRSARWQKQSAILARARRRCWRG